jgi:hypothetical protein
MAFCLTDDSIYSIVAFRRWNFSEPYNGWPNGQLTLQLNEAALSFPGNACAPNM